MRKVTIVVPVLITSCQVSLKPKSGPVIAQTTIVPNARIKAAGRPVACAAAFAKRLNHEFFFIASSGVRPLSFSDGESQVRSTGPSTQMDEVGMRH